jgi:hypothetical protein
MSGDSLLTEMRAFNAILGQAGTEFQHVLAAPNKHGYFFWSKR